MTHEFLKESVFTEILYECYADISESDDSFVPMVCTYFEFDMEYADGTTLEYDFTDEQMQSVREV